MDWVMIHRIAIPRIFNEKLHLFERAAVWEEELDQYVTRLWRHEAVRTNKLTKIYSLVGSGKVP